MTSILRLIEKQNLSLILLIIISFLLVPSHNASAQASEPLVFDVSQEALQTSMLSYQELAANDYIVQELTKYLTAAGSPLAPYAAEIVKLPQWQHALGITFVESHFCRTAKNNNCGSIGVGPSHRLWRTYPTAYDGFTDLTKLLEKPMYKERLNTCKKKLGVYVVPGSRNWLNGCERVQKEMEELTLKADQIRTELAQQHLAAKENHPLLAIAF